MADHLVNSEESLIMSYEGIRKNGCKPLADGPERVPWDIACNNIFDILVACKDVSAVCTVPGFEQ